MQITLHFKHPIDNEAGLESVVLSQSSCISE